jgi:hypothetical protein
MLKSLYTLSYTFKEVKLLAFNDTYLQFSTTTFTETLQAMIWVGLHGP